jgi:two-component sensor histidine kinase
VEPPEYTFDETRLKTLEAFDILDTPAETGFDDIVRLAAQICGTAVSLVSFVSRDRQWFKARVGFAASETDLSRSVCAHALIEPDLLVIEDLSLDPRTAANPLVTDDPGIRFYAGAPLRASNGEVLGSLCVIDAKPRREGLSAAQAEGLRGLARQVIIQMDLRRALAERDALLADVRRASARRNGLLAVGDRLRVSNAIPDMTRAAAEIAATTLGLVRAGFARIDATGEFIDVEADWSAPGFASLAGRHRVAELGDALARAEVDVVEDVAAAPRAAASRDWLIRGGARAAVNVPLRDPSGSISLLFAHGDQPRAWSREDIAFLINVGDRCAASVARAEAEALQRFLNLELNHRMKNALTMTQAIAKQTLRSVPDQEPVQAFMARLQALATANDVLFQDNLAPATIRDVARRVLATVQGIDRFALTGPNIVMGPRATLSLSLLLHELSTNAMKYGALSVRDGRVDLSWEIRGDGLALHWRETGGPEVVEPARKGFGTKLVTMGLLGTGGADIHYRASGLQADFSASLAQMRDA